MCVRANATLKFTFRDMFEFNRKKTRVLAIIKSMYIRKKVFENLIMVVQHKAYYLKILKLLDMSKNIRDIILY